MSGYPLRLLVWRQFHPLNGTQFWFTNWNLGLSINVDNSGHTHLNSSNGAGNIILNDINGNVGIGTASPGAKLDVAGNLKISASGASLAFPDGTVRTTAYTGGTGSSLTATSATVNIIPMFTGTSQVGNSPIAISGGNVGIGMISPTAALDIQGRIGQDDGYDHTELSQNAWGGSHTLAFGAYQGATAPGQSDYTGWFQNSYSAGSYGYGPALMEYLANGGAWNFFIGPQSTGAGQNVVWGMPALSLHRGGNVGIGTTAQARRWR